MSESRFKLTVFFAGLVVFFLLTTYLSNLGASPQSDKDKIIDQKKG